MSTSGTNRIRILAVDDERYILELYQNISYSSGDLSDSTFEEDDQDLDTCFDLTLCEQGDEAVEVVELSIAQSDPFAVIFLDMLMPPGPDGMRTAEEIHALDPYTEIVFVTGYSNVKAKDIADRVLPHDKLFYLKKPSSLLRADDLYPVSLSARDVS